MVIPNGIDIAQFSSPNGRPHRTLRGTADPLCCFSDGWSIAKGFKYLLRAWPWVRAAVPNARLLVVGAYNKRQKRPYVLYARKRNIRGVRFVGPASERDKARFYHTADVFCAPSTGFESFGIVLLEGMASGVPVVASDIPGFRSVLDDGVQGVLAEPRNPHAIAKAIIELLEDPERRVQMGQAGRLKAAAYDWPRVAQQVLDYYQNVLAELGEVETPSTRSKNGRIGRRQGFVLIEKSRI